MLRDVLEKDTLSKKLVNKPCTARIIVSPFQIVVNILVDNRWRQSSSICKNTFNNSYQLSVAIFNLVGCFLILVYQSSHLLTSVATTRLRSTRLSFGMTQLWIDSGVK